MSEEELDEFEESIGYNPDKPLIIFEDNYEFHSLRKYSEDIENDWLDSSDQIDWSWENDPTSDIFVDGVEQTVYNPYYEFIICNTLYKLTDDGILYIPIDYPNMTNVLSEINKGGNPQEVVNSYNGTIVNDDNILRLELPTPNTLVFEPVIENTTL